jgi:NAD(P)-dependent dehydrogenase (short-subunit alcohol dehydrogenase family)
MGAVPADSGLSGRTAWVTGAGGGMGARHAERLAQAGARVACLDLDGDAAERVAAGIRAGGGAATARAMDVGDWDATSRTAEAMAQELGPAGIVVANAGVLGPVAAVSELEPTAWSDVLRVNLTGVFHTVKAAIPQMQPRGGAMVLVSSISGLRGYAGAAAYNASKHGVIGLMRTLANELAGAGIRVNAVCPGWVDTPMFDAQVEIAGLPRAEAISRWAPDQLIERLVTPDEVSDAVLWLLSDAARMITGISLPVDGGMLERTLVHP